MAAMNFLELVGPKSGPGSLLNWVNYKKVPAEVVLEEAQALIYSRLRVREMRASAVITLPVQAFSVALPTGFLEAIAMRDRAGIDIIPDRHIEERGLLRRRPMDDEAYTTLSAQITAGAGSLTVSSAEKFPATAPFSVMIDAECVLVTAGAGTTSWTVTRGYGGTTAAAHASGATVDGALQDGTPSHLAIFNERFEFDCKADEARRYDLTYYKTPDALSASNTTNFLTRRYPMILRIGCLAGAASFMKDDAEEQKQIVKLMPLIEAANAESDLGRPS